MQKTQIEWVKNPDGTQGYTWNPITGCLNGCEYCYARKLANGRLRARYLANPDVAPGCDPADPFAPRYWPNRRYEPLLRATPSGIFAVDMGDLFGPWLPARWTKTSPLLPRLSRTSCYAFALRISPCVVVAEWLLERTPRRAPPTRIRGADDDNGLIGKPMRQWRGIVRLSVRGNNAPGGGKVPGFSGVLVSRHVARGVPPPDTVFPFRVAEPG